MKKLQCEVCGSTEITKIGDDQYQCAFCGVQYSTKDVRKLLHEFSGTVQIDHREEAANAVKRAEQLEAVGESVRAREYYEKALDLDADNETAQERFLQNAKTKVLDPYYIIEPDVDPKENVKDFLKQLASIKSIACDVYKEISIKSVTEQYFTFLLMKVKYDVSWSAVACYTTIDKVEDGYKVRHSSSGTKLQTQYKYQTQTNRVPVNGRNTFFNRTLCIGSPALGEATHCEDSALRDALIEALEKQQYGKYDSYDVHPIDLRKVKEENGQFTYDGLPLIERISTATKKAKKQVFVQTTVDNAKADIISQIGGDSYENLNMSSKTLLDTVTPVCIPIQIIEYTYKGKDYVAVSDLISHTTSIPTIYPCDTELAAEQEKLDNKRQKASGMPTITKLGLALGVIGIVLVFFFALMGDSSFSSKSLILTLLCMAGSLALIISGLVLRSIRNKQAEKATVDIKKNFTAARMEALKQTMEVFFKAYTDYASAESAAAATHCMEIAATHPALHCAGQLQDFEEKEAYSKDEDILCYGLSLYKARHNWLWLTVLGGIGLAVLGILIVAGKCWYYSQFALGMLMLVAGVGSAFVLSLILLTKLRGKVMAIRAYLDQLANNSLSSATDAGMKETVEKLRRLQEQKAQPISVWFFSWAGKHKLALIIPCVLVALLLLGLVAEPVVAELLVAPYEKQLSGTTLVRPKSFNDYLKGHPFTAYQFHEDGTYTEYNYYKPISKELYYELWEPRHGTWNVRFALFSNQLHFVDGYGYGNPLSVDASGTIRSMEDYGGIYTPGELPEIHEED